MKHGKPMCRFTGSSGHVMYTEGIFVHSKKAEQVNDTSKLPNSIRCTTPVWTDSSKVKLDLSLNGYDFSGDIDYTFGDLLLLHRVVPMAGPISTSTQSTRLLGQGFRPNDANLQYENKWGVLETNTIQKSQVHDYRYYFSSWLTIDGEENQELHCYWYEAANHARVDSELYDGNTYHMYGQSSPKINGTTI